MADDSRSKIWFDAVRKVGLSKPSPTVIEVGVGQGGRMALAALALTKSCNQLDSEIFGFDRFANPLDHGAVDSKFDSFANKFSKEAGLSEQRLPFMNNGEAWMNSVSKLCASTGFSGQVKLIQGEIENEAPGFINSRSQGFEIDALSVSCNWYSAVRASLSSFLPFLAPTAVIMLDGYFYWGGFEQASRELGMTEAHPGAFRLGDCLVIQT